MKTSVLFNKLGSYPLSFNMGEMLKLPSKWIAGFSAGEISFNLTLENKSSYKLGLRPRVSISLPQDKRDLSILISIQNHLGCGYITKDSGDRKVWYYRCDNLEELENKIVPFFTQNNLVFTPNKTSALGYRVVATFAISQTASEKLVLEAIQSFLGCGFIRTRSLNIPGRLPVCEFQVNAFKDILNVVLPFFNANPLLTRISKRLNYLDFEAIMRLVERKEHLSQSGLEPRPNPNYYCKDESKA
jgi:LAGLIDADG endonuclease